MSPPPSFADFFLLFLLTLINPIHASCQCGYTLPPSNTTTSPHLYTHILETDFQHLSSFSPISTAPSPLNSSDWLPQEYTVPASLARGPYGKNASVGDVRLNPVAEGGGGEGLEIWVRSLGEMVGKGALIGMGEVASRREDMLFGTFRVGMKMSAIAGTCAAFFWYYNDTQEIDLEFLSRQSTPTSHPLNLVLQSPASFTSGYDAANTSTFTLYPLPFDPTTSFHEYRFDWSPTSVSFYADGSLLHTMTEAIPQTPGHITLNHWSNGDDGWSGGPPARDAVLVVEYVKAYFNSSDPGLRDEWERGCRDVDAGNATCEIPDEVGPPVGGADPKMFISGQGNQTGGKGAGKKNEAVGGRERDSLVERLFVSAVLLFAISIFS